MTTSDPKRMSIHRHRMMVATLVAGVCGWGVGARALDLNDVSFRASFKDGLKADIATGKAEPVEVIGKPEIVPGRNGGRALRLRNGVDAVGFDLAGNLNPQAGALSLWMAPGTNWGYNEKGAIVGGESQVLFHTGDIGDVPQRIVLQTYWRPDDGGHRLLGMLTHGSDGLLGAWPDGVFQNLFPMPTKATNAVANTASAWTHFLFTWREGRMEAYVNGARVRQFERLDLSLRQLGDRFYLGWKKDPHAKANTNDPMCMTKGIVTFDPSCAKPATPLMDTPWETLLSDVTVLRGYVTAGQASRIFSAGVTGPVPESGSGGSGGLSRNSVLFYASFDKDMTPDICRGEPADVKAVAMGRPMLVDGKSGKALRIVSGKSDVRSGVTYPLEGHVKADKGTLAFWMSAGNWDAKDEVLQILFTTDGLRRLQIQNNPATRSSLDLMWYTGRYINQEVTGFDKCAAPLIAHETLVEGIDRMMPGVWFHMTYAWGDGEVRAYRNGVFVGKTAYPKMEYKQTQELGQRFAIGASRQFGGRYITEPADLTGKQYGESFKATWAPLLDRAFVTLIDEFAVFDRNLNEAQIGRLYKQGVPGFMASEAGDEDRAELRVKPLPTRGRIVFEAIHGAVPTNATASIRITKQDRPSKTREMALTIRGDMSRGEMKTKRLPAGVYEVEFQVRDKAGKTLARNEKGQTFDLAEHEEWWSNRIGLDDIVPTPWTPMTKAGDSVSCWGRTISFNGKAMPEQIISKGETLLAAPIGLDVTLAGKKLTWANGKVKYPLVSETAMERVWRGEEDGLEMTVQARTEFDGFIWTTVTFENRSGKPVTGLKLEVACVQSNALFIHTPGRGWRGECPPDVTTRKEWKSAYDGFSNPVWLGGYERGIQWLAEGRGGWFNKDKSDEIAMRPEGDRVTLTVKMIDSPCERKTFTVKFGLHPTPVKALLARSNRVGVSTYGVVPTLPRGSSKDNLTEQAFLKKWGSMGDDEKQKAFRETSPKFYRYSFINSVASYYADGEEIRERKWYKSEWEKNPGSERLDPLSWSYFSVCADSSYADWWVWFIKERWLHRDYANMAGIYFDHGHPIYCCNPLHDGQCGYLDENGVMQPELKIVAMRNLLKRIYCAVKGIDKAHPQGTTPDHPVVLHMSTAIYAPHASFASLFDGETWNVPGAHFMDRLTLDFMAAEWSPTAWGYDERGTCFKFSYFLRGFDDKRYPGLKGDWLRPLRVQNKKPEGYDAMMAYLVSRERECNAMFLLVDRTPGFQSSYLKCEEPVKTWGKARDAFGFYQDDVEFNGFWKTGAAVKGQTDKLNVSAYVRKAVGKILLVVVNRNDATVSPELTLDVAGLGLKSMPVKLTNAETGTPIVVTPGSGGTIKVTPTIPGRDYVLMLAE